ncbi:MAG: MCE family protein [Solirubrobacterales bacterium]|nr:MCE family protein [Solirubrobacterales bacterium]
MKRLLLSGALLIAIAAFVVLAEAASSPSSASATYKIELDDAFGLTPGAQLKIGGVPAGTLAKIELCAEDPSARCQNPLHAVVTIQVTDKGFDQFRSDAFCQSRPQSLIGEYFIDCQPGQNGTILEPGSTIPVTHTESTIPADLLLNVMRMPYRQRLTLIINELGAAVAARSGDLQAALRRAVPALTETDNLLNLLAGDSRTLQSLTANADTVLTALANNRTEVKRFITEAGRTASATATQNANLRQTLAELPGFLEQLKPAMAELGAAAVANEPVVGNLNAASGQLSTLFTNLAPCSLPHGDAQCGFADATRPALKSLGQASLTGRPAMIAARPTVAQLNQFAQPTPELAQNLAIVLQDLDSQGRAVEPDRRSPGGKGFSGLQALLQYAFNQPLAINSFSNFSHLLNVDAFIDPRCAMYATPQTVAGGLAAYGPSYRQCYAWLGPSQPGINETDPSDPSACVPDPGGAPPGRKGPKTTACKLTTATAAATARDTTRAGAGPPAGTASAPANGAKSSAAAPTQAQQLLNYLLAP